MNVSSLALQLQRQVVINSAWKLWFWHYNLEKYSFLDEYVSKKLKMY
jgi:hypothetical protein